MTDLTNGAPVWTPAQGPSGADSALSRDGRRPIQNGREKRNPCQEELIPGPAPRPVLTPTPRALLPCPVLTPTPWPCPRPLPVLTWLGQRH